MIKNIKTIRSILLNIESGHLSPEKLYEPQVQGINQTDLDFHLALMEDEGYLTLHIIKNKCETKYYVKTMRSKGYMYLDSIRLVN